MHVWNFVNFRRFLFCNLKVFKAISLSVGQSDTAWAMDRTGHLHQLALTDLEMKNTSDCEGEDWTMIE